MARSLKTLGAIRNCSTLNNKSVNLSSKYAGYGGVTDIYQITI